MRRTIVAVVLSFSPVPAIAQQSEPVIPRVEVGLGTGAAAYPHGGGGGSTGQVRIGVGITKRFGVEAALGLEGWQFDANSDLVYTVQGRYSLSSTPRRLMASLTFGGSGVIDRYRTQGYRRRLPSGAEVVEPARSYSRTYPPIAPTVGVAIHYAITRRVAVRADVQAVFCPYFDAVGALVSAGVAIPIGSRSR